MAMNFHEVIINCKITDSNNEHIHKKEISKYLLMLPMSNNDNISNTFNNKLIYAGIDSEWGKIGTLLIFSLPMTFFLQFLFISHFIYEFFSLI